MNRSESETKSAVGHPAPADALLPCPCGKVPVDVSVVDAGQGGKWAWVTGACCGEWHVEFRTGYAALDSEECKALAIKAWNAGGRSPASPLAASPAAATGVLTTGLRREAEAFIATHDGSYEATLARWLLDAALQGSWTTPTAQQEAGGSGGNKSVGALRESAKPEEGGSA